MEQTWDLCSFYNTAFPLISYMFIWFVDCDLDQFSAEDETNRSACLSEFRYPDLLFQACNLLFPPRTSAVQMMVLNHICSKALMLPSDKWTTAVTSIHTLFISSFKSDIENTKLNFHVQFLKHSVVGIPMGQWKALHVLYTLVHLPMPEMKFWQLSYRNPILSRVVHMSQFAWATPNLHYSPA